MVIYVLSLFTNIGHFDESDFPMGIIIDRKIINRNIIKEMPRYIGSKKINDSIVVNAK